MKSYYVARIKPWHGGSARTATGKPQDRTYLQAVIDIDYLSYDALSPIIRIDARNQAEAKKLFLEELKLA